MATTPTFISSNNANQAWLLTPPGNRKGEKTKLRMSSHLARNRVTRCEKRRRRVKPWSAVRSTLLHLDQEKVTQTSCKPPLPPPKSSTPCNILFVRFWHSVPRFSRCVTSNWWQQSRVEYLTGVNQSRFWTKFGKQPVWCLSTWSEC